MAYNILIAGRAVPEKNIPKSIDLAFELSSHIEGVRCMVVSPVTEKSPDEICIIRSRCELYGFELISSRIPQAELKKLIVKSDLFILLSVNETFGQVYLESLLNKVPVVCAVNEGISGMVNSLVCHEYRSIDGLLSWLRNHQRLDLLDYFPEEEDWKVRNALSPLKSFYKEYVS